MTDAMTDPKVIKTEGGELKIDPGHSKTKKFQFFND